MNSRILPLIGLFAFAAVVSSILKPEAPEAQTTSPAPQSSYEQKSYERCMDPTSGSTKLALEKEYTGEKPKGWWEAYCRDSAKKMATIYEIEHRREEYRAKNRSWTSP